MRVPVDTGPEPVPPIDLERYKQVLAESGDSEEIELNLDVLALLAVLRAQPVLTLCSLLRAPGS